MDLILKYFPDLTDLQKEQFEKLGPLYTEWNQNINVISRKDIDNLYPHHILHSLAIAKKVTTKEPYNMETTPYFPSVGDQISVNSSQPI